MDKRFAEHHSRLIILMGLFFFVTYANPVFAFREKPDDVVEYTCGTENTEGKKILIAYDTEHGATATIADKIGQVLCEKGFQVELVLARNVSDVSAYDAVLIGTPIYTGSWLPGVMQLLQKQKATIAKMPHALFINCTYLKEDTEEIRRKVLELWVTPVLDKFPEISPLEIGLFGGQFSFDELYPLEYVLMMLMKYKDGDYRDFAKVTAWAELMAETLQ
jgi:menaquinone-dependent protoporphyrinogen oxidase